jgi:hypothetical protein
MAKKSRSGVHWQHAIRVTGSDMLNQGRKDSALRLKGNALAKGKGFLHQSSLEFASI